MGATKRKEAPGGGIPPKKAKPSTDSRPAKRESFGGKGADNDSNNRKPNAGSHATEPAIISRVKDDEPMFPRGGGSVLTPLEQKQIQMEAKADAQKEDEFEVTEKSSIKKDRKRRAKDTFKPTNGKPEKDENAVKIESLNFKRLVKGSIVLGQISGIGFQSLSVALPNNLTGTVSMAAISETITSRLEKEAEASEEESDEEDEESNLELESMFRIGQYVRAYVLSTKSEEASSRHNIELSLRPSETNSGLSKNDVVANATVMAAVSSIQDHGYEMELGINDDKIKAFLPKKEVSSDVSEARLQPGAVALCMVKSVSGKVAQLTLDSAKLSKVDNIANDATTVNTFQPGTAVDVLVSNVTGRGIAATLLGHLPVTADLIHSGAGPEGVDLTAKYKVGSRIKARVICNFPGAKNPKLGISLLPHVLSLQSKTSGRKSGMKNPIDLLPIASYVEKCTVRNVEPEIGLYVDIGIQGLAGFVHISKVKDGKVDALFESSGPYKVDTIHRGRVVGYSPFDGMFLMSFEKSVLEQQFLRLEDVPVGQVVTGTIERVIVGGQGVSGLVVRVAQGISGYVHETHLADVRLQHPERKFREGMTVKARVLSIRPRKRQMRLTLKKTLVNSDAPIIQSFEDVEVGAQALGTISDISPRGARIEFYRGVRGFLHVSEMSEAFIQDPKEHFKVGQVLNVHVVDVNPEERKLFVSCKDPSAFGIEKQTALKALTVGSIVSAKVSEKTDQEIFVELDGSGLRALLPTGHLTDKSASKNQSALKRIHAGQTLTNLMVLDKNERRRAIVLTSKPSLVEAAKEGTLLRNYSDAKVGNIVTGFVSNIRSGAVLVQFAGNLVGVMFKTRLPQEDREKENFGMRKHQSVTVKIVAVDLEKTRLIVAPATADEQAGKESKPAPKYEKTLRPPAHGPVEDVTFGQVLDTKVVGVHETQLNVETTDKVQGRVDISQIFDSFDDIKDPAEPLAQFQKGDNIQVRAVGLHDAKNHKFLAFSHRSYTSVLEFTAKPSDVKADKLKTLELDKVKVGSSYVAFVNNVSPYNLWVNISPLVRGRINAVDASDDLAKTSDLEGNFDVGMAVKVKVTAVDAAKGRLDLSARSSTAPALTWDTLKPNQVLAGIVTKVNERQILVKLSPEISGAVHLVDMSDDYSDVNTLKYSKGEHIKVSVVELDKSNKRIRLSTRASRVLNSASPVTDREVKTVKDVKSGETVRGFIKHVADQGVFVLLGGSVTGMVRVKDLSDRFLKEWKDHFQVDELVKARILSVEEGTDRIQLSLKSSVVDENYVPAKTYNDIKAGQIITGKVRKVEEFGAFIVVDDSHNVSGLCHRSQMADKPVEDARKLYQEGDAVKAKVLSVDAKKKRISFGLKSAYIEDNDTDMDSDGEGAALESDEEDEDDVDSDEGMDLMDGGAPITFLGTDNQDSDDDEDEDDEDEDDEDEDEDDDIDEDGDVDMAGKPSKKSGLSAGKYDWTGDAFEDSDKEDVTGKSAKKKSEKKQKKKKADDDEIQIDRTADLDVGGPQTSSDFERLLLGKPDDSSLWIAYIALQMQVSELTKAREIAERALRTINIREQTEKLNVWIAYLNLESEYGTRQSLDEVFQRACQYNDAQEVHERLATIYIQSAKTRRADELFQSMISKFGSKSPDLWPNYAHFLHVTVNQPDRARALLPRATQALGERHTPNLMAKFGALEFRSPNGDAERGRTTFETLLATWPKRFDFWNQLVDLEVSSSADPATIRDVFERGTKVKGLKPKKAMKWFKRWADWEEKMDPKGKEKVMLKAQDWVAAAHARKAAAAAKDEEEDDE